MKSDDLLKKEKKQREEKLAEEVLLLARSTLMVNLRFMDNALSRLPLVPRQGPLQCDGSRIWYDPEHILRCVKAERQRPARDYLHMVLHCIFRHSFVGTMVDRQLWDLACDIAVETAISGLKLECAAASRQFLQEPDVERIRREVKLMSAEKIYRWRLDTPPGAAELRRLKQRFEADDHGCWYGDAPYEAPDQQAAAAAGGSASGADAGEDMENAGAGPEPDWKEISEQIQEDLQTFSRARSAETGDLLQNLLAVNRERIDYAEFLRKFSEFGEEMQINDDEFDYIFYTYGLRLYDNMPLVEPLEYKEVKKVKEFVIAIDTSGSVQGELVQRFVEKTWNILKTGGTFFTKVNIHIIQCDAQIQSDTVIRSDADFDRFLEGFKLKGFGGTDFRPVFAYVDGLMQSGELENLKGLIYFTDGLGTYPEQKPPYETAFVFLDDDSSGPAVPPWAMRVVLESESL